MYHKQHDTIMVFDREYFESILPRRKSNNEPLWRHGISMGEHVYWVDIDDQDIEILVRSSIDPVTDYSREKSKDSIRVYLVKTGTVEYVAVKAYAWTTRLPGWEKRLYNQLSTVRQWRLTAQQKGDKCPVCKNIRIIFRVISGESENKGRLFIKCLEHDKWPIWIT